MYSNKNKNIFLSLATSFCLLLLGLCSISANFSYKTNVLAEDAAPSYFTAKVSTTSYVSGQSVFLDDGQKLVITFGKPVGSAIEGTTEVYNSQTSIGDYALSWQFGSFKLTINDQVITDTEPYFTENSIQKITYFYAPDYVEGDSTSILANYEYFVIEIDLSKTELFTAGKYDISFENYMENSGVDYGFSQTLSYSATFYVFQTTDYFSSDSATSQNLTFNNLRVVSPIGATYKNYYFFNYSNITNNSITENYLPSLTLDAKKFIVSVVKSNQGTSESCVVNSFASQLVTLGANSTENFINAVYDEETEKITIYFNDIGDYRLSYQFVYENTDGSYTELVSTEITNVNKKYDMLYVYGYQLNYSDSATQLSKEFKLIEDGQTGGTNSADVSYAVNYETLKGTTLSSISDDTAIMTAISGSTPASTNQPAVFTNYNVYLNLANSYYYKFDTATNDWAKSNDAYVKNPFLNDFFTDEGTYLLKVVYNFEKNLNSNGNLASSVYFAQYFYFNITNSNVFISMAELVDETENEISTNAFTKNDVKITLPGQSIFNSTVRVDVYIKDYTASYSTTPTLSIVGTTVSQSQTFTQNKNYKVVLNFINNKKQTSYFTIDDTAFENVAIYNVKASTSTNGYYTKDLTNLVSFYTNQSVAIQWSEKASGASSTAYYKYIPFVETASTLPNSSQFIDNNAIAVDFKMNFDVGASELTSATYKNTINSNLLSSGYFFSEQGFYIIKLSDSAGNWQYITFCIDKTEIKIGQFSNDAYQTVQNYNVVSIDTELQWGGFKLINTNIAVNQLSGVVDTWVKEVFYQKLSNDNDLLSSGGKYYFAPEIASTAYVLMGNTYQQLNNVNKYLIELEKLVDNKTFANEISYIFYLIDESNPYFNRVSTITQSEFVTNASIDYKITTTSDASMANIVLNDSSNNANDVSSISYNSSNLTQAGFTDSFTTNENNEPLYETADLRTKYFYSSGTTINGDISLLTYIFLPTPSENIAVEKIEVFYYPFVAENGSLSTTALSTVVYDLTNNINNTFALSGDFVNYYAFNLNSIFLSETSNYITPDGKYVIVRTYTTASENFVDEFDFMTRECSFVVDRENIVSLPTNLNDDITSIIGQEIYVNVLDGLADSLQFTKLSLAYNTDSYILETNKLPVVVYIPISKYGYDISDNNKLFTLYSDLQYFYTTSLYNTNKLLNRYTLSSGTTTSILYLSYFGETNVNTTNISNPSFDLTSVIEYSSTINGAKTQLTLTKNGNNTQNYYTSAPLTQSGYYFITITQNALTGLTYPNAYKTFSFMFYISQQTPDFDFVEILENGQDGDVLNTDANNVSYTNANSVKISWTDPNDEYLAKIDLTNVNDRVKGIYYYTNINYKTYLPLSSINTEGNYHYSTIDISSYPNGTILYVHMQYEGQQNDSSYITKELCIDRNAPESVLSQLINQTAVNGINVASYSREYADSTSRYNITKTDGAYAYYVFALPLNATTLNSYFYPQVSVGNYYKNGYYYNLKLIDNISTYQLTSISSAKDPRVSHNLTISVSTLFVNHYYEVIERDLAGNISIYVIYFVQNLDSLQVLTFDKVDTEYNTETNIKYSELQENQNIFAKAYFDVTSINLYNYNWLTFSVDGIIYQKTPALETNSFYNISSWTVRSVTPQIVTLSEIMNWLSGNTKHVITIIDPTKSINYTLNIFISNEELTISTLSSTEGVLIVGKSYTNGPTIALTSLIISSWETDSYVEIYNFQDIFSSNDYVIFSASSNQWTFSIIEPRVAYKYVYIDNFGNSGIFYHTCGEVEIPENEKIVGFVDSIYINDSELGSQLWSVGYENIDYFYNNVNYEVYINLQVLIFNTETRAYEWETVTPTGIVNADYGSKVYYGVSTPYYSCTLSTKSSSINKITLITPTSTEGLSTFNGGITKYIITLMSTKVDINGDVIQDQPNPDYILINNLCPNITLLDKNGTNRSDLIDSEIIFSGQLTINIPKITYESDFVFQIVTNLQFNNGEEFAISSGTCVEETGTYYIKTYIVIDNVYYLYSTKTFIISESSSNFYTVKIFNSTTNSWEVKQSTGKVFEHNNKYYASHYIVNTLNYMISLNEEQEIQMSEIEQYYITNDGVITRFYEITNRNSANNSINYYTNYIAITYISTNTLLNENSFYYLSTNGGAEPLEGISGQVIITSDDQSFTSLKIMFNSYFGIPENKININIVYDDNQEYVYTPTVTKLTDTISYITLTHSGNYTISFSDQAGNVQTFQDETKTISEKNYKLTYINGVSFYINGNTPIENGIYNNSVTITLPQNLNSLYEKGGQPSITVLKNNSEIEIEANDDGEYIITGSGYYKVYFDAKINNLNVKRQITNFTIINNNEFRWAFEYSQFSNYEIISVLKNGVSMDYSNYFDHNTYTIGNETVKYLKNILVSLYDEITGVGTYQITVKTNSSIQNETFTFSFKIKNFDTIPLTISAVEGSTTTDVITVSFNAYDIYNNLGECKVLVGENTILINQAYLDSISDVENYYMTYDITETGTYFIQIVTDSDKVLYSYRIMKAEPLNAISIVIIVFSVLATSALVVTFILLRRNMKIK